MQRIPHCAHWGAFTALVENGKLVGVEPFEKDPTPSPMLNALKDWFDPSVRIDQPYVREGWLRNRLGSDRTARGRDRYVPVTWDVALGLAAGEIDRVRHTHSNDSIFAGSYGWASAGRLHHGQSLVKRLMNQIGGYTGHKDSYSKAAGAVLLRHVLGTDDSASADSTTLDTIAEHTDLFLAFGAMSHRTAQVEAGGVGRHMLYTRLRAVAERKVRVIHISPRRDDLPGWLNAEWWPIRPGTDAALALALAGEIVAAGKQDDAFLARCTSGADRLLAYLRGESDGIPKTAEWAAPITGIDAVRIKSLAASIPGKRMFMTMSWSLQRQVHGEQPWWAGIGLASVAGQIGLPGGGIAFGIGSTGGVAASTSLTKSPTLPQGEKPNGAFIPVARICDLLLSPGTPFTYEGREHVYPDTRLLYWVGGNPFHHHQDLARLERAWAVPETIIVQEIVWSPTAKRADIVLPATTSLERNDIAGSRRSDYIMAMRKAVEPMAQSRPDYDIVRDLAERLGVTQAFTDGLDEMGWIRRMYGEVRGDAAKRFSFDMPEFEAFWEMGATPVPARKNFTYLGDYRQNPTAHPLKTESGRIVLGSKLLASRNYADCPAHAIWMAPPEWLGSAKIDKYPFHLVSAQPYARLHSQLDFSRHSRIGKVGGREAVTLHPVDAERIGVKSGDTAMLTSERGKCLAGVRISAEVREGVALLPTGAWYAPVETADGIIDNAGNPNMLTLDVPSSAFSGGCSAHTCLVAITRYAGNLAAPGYSAPERVEAAE